MDKIAFPTKKLFRIKTGLYLDRTLFKVSIYSENIVSRLRGLFCFFYRGNDE